MDRETLGREVRAVWVAWAEEQPDPKPSWLVPWEGLGEADREVDRRIGERLYALARTCRCLICGAGHDGTYPYRPAPDKWCRGATTKSKVDAPNVPER